MQETGGMRWRFLANSDVLIMGIYKIENIKNHKIYIGSSKDLNKRWKEHLYALKGNKHHSCKLQLSYNRLKDKSTLQFSIVERVDNIDNLKIREQYYIDLYDAYNSGYNCSEQVDNPKYALKNQKKSKNNKTAKLYYKEFENLYNKDIFKFPTKILIRVEQKEYKHLAIYQIVTMMRLFLKYYKESPYMCRIYFDGKSCYMEICTNVSYCNRYCVRYKFVKELVIADYPTHKDDIAIQKDRTHYCNELFEWFTRYPTLELSNDNSFP